MWNSKDLTIAECRYTETSVYVDGINYRLKSLAKWSNQVTSSSFYLCHLSTACIVYTHKRLNLTHPTIISTGHEHLHIITISTHYLYRAYPIPAISHFTILPFHSSSKPRLRLFINRYGENMVENDSKVGSSSNLSVKPNSKGPAQIAAVNNYSTTCQAMLPTDETATPSESTGSSLELSIDSLDDPKQPIHQSSPTKFKPRSSNQQLLRAVGLYVV